MPPELERYRKYVDRFDLTEAQKIELIHSVRHILENYVERAFRSDPTQICMKGLLSKDASAAGDMIDLGKSEYQDLSQNFNDTKGEL